MELPKNGGGGVWGAWTVGRFKGGGGLGEKEGVVFLRGLDTPMHTIDMLQAGFEPNLILRKKWHKTTLFHANNFISV